MEKNEMKEIINNINIDFNNTLHSKMELSPWELLPEFILMTFILLGIHQVWTQKKKLYYGKKRRWERKKKILPISLKTPITQAFTVNTLDISLSGAFLDYEDLKKNRVFMNVLDKHTGNMRVGDLIDVEIPMGPFRKISCQARLIRFNFSEHGIPPKGMAIEFIHLNEDQLHDLDSLISDDPDENKPQAA